MKTFFLLLAGMLILGQSVAQSIYARTFGNASDPSIVFLHGGPGYNAANFEATTAKALADAGFFVLVYDRRGEGRSPDSKAQFSFAQTINDLDSLCRRFGIRQPMLIGHSFGGLVATAYAEAFPDRVGSIVLAGAPISLPASFRHIIASCEKIYSEKNDSISLRYIATLKTADTSAYEYSSYCLGHAMQNGFYTPKDPTDSAKALYATFKTDSLLMKHAKKMAYAAPLGFWRNEKYTTADISERLGKLVKTGIRVYGMYGKDDGLYSSAQIEALAGILGRQNVLYIDRCSHNVFIDRQEMFIEALVRWK